MYHDYVRMPAGHIKFAGEHTEYPHGWINTALKSGLRTVDEIIEDVCKDRVYDDVNDPFYQKHLTKEGQPKESEETGYSRFRSSISSTKQATQKPPVDYNKRAEMPVTR